MRKLLISVIAALGFSGSQAAEFIPNVEINKKQSKHLLMLVLIQTSLILLSIILTAIALIHSKVS
jgi:hypothetical protein